MKKDIESRLKDYEDVVQAATNNTQPLDDGSVHIIENLVSDIETPDDPVYQVTCLQLVADLATSNQALRILQDKQVPARLIALLNDSDPLIVPHALKFFYKVDPIDLETKYPQVMDKICDYCQSDNPQLLDYAIDFMTAIGQVGYSARKVIDNHEHFRDKCLSRLGSIIKGADTAIKSKALKCIVELLKTHHGDPKEESKKLKIRINALLILAAVADTEWAQRELSKHPNFVKWMLDRSTEKSKESKEAKFELLTSLVQSRTTSAVFGGEDFLLMRADFKKGPYHVGIAEEMLMEDQNIT